MTLGLLMLRLIVGLLFVGHGAQKLFGSFGGHGLRGTARMFEQIGLKPGHVHARAAGALELAGGVLLTLGLFTPLGSAAVIAVMTAAVMTVHGPRGVWATEGGYEYNVVLAAVAFALAAVGPGSASVDHAVGLSMQGGVWGIVALIIGAAGGVMAVVRGRRYERERQPTAPQRPTTA